MLIFWLNIFILIGLFIYVLNRKHLLMLLLSLEFIGLSLYMYLFNYFMNFISESYFMLIYLILMVCEGVLGLSILVSLIRTHSNDYMKSFNILW